jgi:hypothetical protein
MIDDDKVGGNSTESTETDTKPKSPSPVGFWDPDFRETRKRVIFLWGRTGECLVALYY